MRTHTIIALWSAAAIAGLASPAAGTVYHVKGSCGNDAWSGTSSDCAAPDGPKATIQAAIDAAANGDKVLVWPHTYHERIDLLGKAIAVRSQAGAQETIIDGEHAGTVVRCVNGEGPATVLEGFTITNGQAALGGGMYNLGSSPTVRDCVFIDNHGEVGAAMRNRGGSSPVIAGCSFINNDSVPSGGGMVNSEGSPFLLDCLFLHNTAWSGGAVINLDPDEGPVTFVNCQFIQNDSTMVFGALIDGSGALLVNCLFSRNVATPTPTGEEMGILNTVYAEPQVINCTIGGNTGAGVTNQYGADLTVRNTIIWGNSERSVEGYADIAYSDIEGGFPGGNINEDPLFVDAGNDNLRLSSGSPCINAGDNGSVPPNITTDLDGNNRIWFGTVDMGAYENGSEPAPAAAGDNDFDNGETVILVPTGGPIDALENALVFVVNISGPDDATFVVKEHEDELYPDAAGYSELSCILSLETSLEDGQYFATLFIPFEVIGDDTVDPAGVNVTCFDPAVGNWSLGVTGNTVDSPGHHEPVGDRLLALDGGGLMVTYELGDYGVYWDPDLQQGFAWANVDHAGDFGLGVAFCPADCLQTPDGTVNIEDILTLLRLWGTSSVGGPCDADFDGVVDVDDFLALLDSWGVCPPALIQADAGASGGASSFQTPTSPARNPDLDGDGAVGRLDLGILQSSWGPCDPDCEADLNRDGRVDTRDYLVLLAGWG